MIAMAKNKLFSIFILALHLSDVAIVMSSPYPKLVGAGEHYEVHITNNLPSNSPPLLLHCASLQDELGNHTLYTGDDFLWGFRVNLFLSTMFFCRFRWSSNNVSHEVFNKNMGDNCVDVKGFGNFKCLWSIRSDGFFLVPKKGAPKKMYDW